MFVRMWGRYQHEAIETKDVGGNTSGDIGVAHKRGADEQTKAGIQFSINLQLVLVL